MKNLVIRGRMFATLTALALGASTLLTGCFDKEECAKPEGSECGTAATVVTTASGSLALQLANGTVLTPSGTTWTSFNATAGEQVTIGYSTKNSNCGNGKSTGATTELGCITAVAPAPTTTATGSN